MYFLLNRITRRKDVLVTPLILTLWYNQSHLARKYVKTPQFYTNIQSCVNGTYGYCKGSSEGGGGGEGGKEEGAGTREYEGEREGEELKKEGGLKGRTILERDSQTSLGKSTFCHILSLGLLSPIHVRLPGLLILLGLLSPVHVRTSGPLIPRLGSLVL